MSNPIVELCKRLEVLSRTRENPDSRHEVEQALRSKWEGVRSEAAKVLGVWRGRRSVVALREALEACEHKPAGWAIRSVLIGSLCKCVDPDDAPWMLDFYFRAGNGHKRAAQHEFWPFVRAVPRDVLRRRIELELHSPSTTHREAAERALRWMEAAR